jgi:hypothetical protein
MSTAMIERTVPILPGVPGHQRRDLKTSINFADEDAYQKQLAAKGGKEDMWQGGDMLVVHGPPQFHY